MILFILSKFSSWKPGITLIVIIKLRPCLAFRFSQDPITVNWPLARIPTRRHIASASLILRFARKRDSLEIDTYILLLSNSRWINLCVVISTVLPISRICCRISQRACLVIMSIPADGSSISTIGKSPIRLCKMQIFLWIPHVQFAIVKFSKSNISADWICEQRGLIYYYLVLFSLIYLLFSFIIYYLLFSLIYYNSLKEREQCDTLGRIVLEMTKRPEEMFNSFPIYVT